MFKRSIKKCTKEQQARQDRCRHLGCIACRMNFGGDQYSIAPLPHEIHHQTECGRQIGQDATVCLCAWHHRGICAPCTTSSQMLEFYGPSLAKGSKPFVAEYGSNAEQLEYQNKLIAQRWAA